MQHTAAGRGTAHGHLPCPGHTEGNGTHLHHALLHGRPKHRKDCRYHRMSGGNGKKPPLAGERQNGFLLKQNGYDGNDDKLLTSFFAEHRQEIADNGFSRRVLRHLPDRSRHLAQIWTAFCFTLALVLFVSLDGVQLILDTLRETFDTAIRSGARSLTPSR